MRNALLTLIAFICLASTAMAHRYTYRYHLRHDYLDRNRAYNAWRGNIYIAPRIQPYHHWYNGTPYYVPPVYKIPNLNLDIRVPLPK